MVAPTERPQHPDVDRDLDAQKRRLGLIDHMTAGVVRLVFAGGMTWEPVDDPRSRKGSPLGFPTMAAAESALWEARYATAQLNRIALTNSDWVRHNAQG